MLSCMMACSGDDTVDVTPITITANDLNISVDENPEEGAVIGVLSASASEGTITYELISSNPVNAIAINSSNGQITIQDASLFDYETTPSVTGQVRLSVGAVSENISVTISIEDLIEAPRNGLIGEYLFSGNANDGSGSGYHAETVTAVLTSDRNNLTNSAYQFNGTQYISIPDFTALSPNTVSVSLWFKSNSTVETQRLIFVGSTAMGRQNYSLNYNVQGSNKSDFRYEPDIPNPGSYAESTTNVNDNVWHHVVGVRDNEAKSLKIYIDGDLESSVTYTYDPITPDTPIQLGRAFTSQYFTGSIDDIRIYNRTLTTNDITLLFNEE